MLPLAYSLSIIMRLNFCLKRAKHPKRSMGQGKLNLYKRVEATVVPFEQLLELREVVRRIIISLIDLGCSHDEKKFDVLNDIVLCGGYNLFTD